MQQSFAKSCSSNLLKRPVFLALRWFDGSMIGQLNDLSIHQSIDAQFDRPINFGSNAKDDRTAPKQKHLIEAAPFGRREQMRRTTVPGGQGSGGFAPPAKHATKPTKNSANIKKYIKYLFMFPLLFLSLFLIFAWHLLVLFLVRLCFDVLLSFEGSSP